MEWDFVLNDIWVNKKEADVMESEGSLSWLSERYFSVKGYRRIAMYADSKENDTKNYTKFTWKYDVFSLIRDMISFKCHQ